LAPAAPPMKTEVKAPQSTPESRPMPRHPPRRPQVASESVRTLLGGQSRWCPVCLETRLRSRQTVCSAACRRERSRRRQAEAHACPSPQPQPAGVATIGDRPSLSDTERKRVDVFPNWAVGTVKADTPRGEADRTVGRLAPAARRSCGWRAQAKRSYAARRTYRSCRPPTSRIGKTFPSSGRSTGLPSGAALVRERWVRAWW